MPEWEARWQGKRGDRGRDKTGCGVGGLVVLEAQRPGIIGWIRGHWDPPG